MVSDMRLRLPLPRPGLLFLGRLISLHINHFSRSFLSLSSCSSFILTTKVDVFSKLSGLGFTPDLISPEVNNLSNSLKWGVESTSTCWTAWGISMTDWFIAISTLGVKFSPLKKKLWLNSWLNFWIVVWESSWRKHNELPYFLSKDYLEPFMYFNHLRLSLKLCR